MSAVKEIETAIRSLSSGGLAELRARFASFDADAWDRRIEDDSESSRLDALYRRLQQENTEKADVPLDAFLDQEKLS